MLALMILLLPLRGWTGDAMATKMAAGQLMVLQAPVEKVSLPAAAPEKIATHTHETLAEGHNHAKNADSDLLTGPEFLGEAQSTHDCVIEASHALHEVTNGGMDCGSCPSCQACHTVALSPLASKSVLIFNVATQPEAATLPYVSADGALSQKPPIS